MRDVVDDRAAPVLGHPADHARPAEDPQAEQASGSPTGRGLEGIAVAVRVLEGDGDERGVQQLGRAVDDELERPLDVELLADHLAELAERGDLLQPPLELVVQVGVLDGDGGVSREQQRQALVVLVEAIGSSSSALSLSVRYRSPRIRPPRLIGTPSSEVIGGWFGGKPEERGSWPMVGMRTGRPSRISTPSRPWPRGSGPIAARSWGVRPLVMKS